MSGMLGVTAEGGTAPNSADEVGVSSPANCTEGGEEATPLPGPCAVGVCSRSEPPVLVTTRVTALVS